MSDENIKKLPTFEEYKNSVINGDFLSDELKSLKPFLNKNGEIYFTNTGGVACIFKLINKNKKNVALKCYRSDEGHSSISYNDLAVIQKKIDSFNKLADKLPFFIKYTYYPDESGIRTTDNFPVALSEWVEGKNIAEFLYEEKNNRNVKNIAVKILDVFEKMRENNFIHCDLSHDNIFITPAHEIKLIDYDYSTDSGSNVLIGNGHPHFQHYARQAKTEYSQDEIKELDNFSEWVIFLTIAVRLLNHSLYKELMKSDDKILFLADDFKHWLECNLYTKIKEIPNEKLQNLLSKFTEHCQPTNFKIDLSKIPPLDIKLCRELLNGIVIPNPLTTFLTSAVTTIKTYKKSIISLLLLLVLSLTLVFLPPQGIPKKFDEFKEKLPWIWLPLRLDAPTFDPAFGTFNSQKNIVINCATEGAEIKYTLDNSEPAGSGIIYNSPITIVSSTKIKAIAVKDGKISDLAEAEYIIASDPAPDPTPPITPSGPTLSGPQKSPVADKIEEYKKAKSKSDYEAIINLGTQLMKEDPNNAIGYEEDIAWAYADKGNLPEAEKRLEVLIDKLKNNSDVKILKTLLEKIINYRSFWSQKLYWKVMDEAEKKKMYDVAIKTAEKLLSLKPQLSALDKAKTLERLGNFYISTGQTENSIKNYKDAIAVYEQLKNSEKSKELKKRILDIKSDLALKHIDAGKESDAIKILTENINEITDKKEKYDYLNWIMELKFKDKSSAQIFIILAGEFKKDNKTDDAINALIKSTVLDNTNPSVLEEIGDLYAAKNAKVEALDNYNKALQLFKRVNDYLAAERVQKKIDDINGEAKPLAVSGSEPSMPDDIAMPLQPTSIVQNDILDPRFTGIILEPIKGRNFYKCRVGVVEITGKAIRPISGSKDTAYKKASAAYNHRNFEEAIEQYCNALKYRRELYENIKNGKPLSELIASRKIDKNDINIINDIGCVYAVYGEDAWAVNFFEWTIQIDPKFKLAYINLFNLYMHLKQVDHARDVKEKFSRLGHTDVDAQITLADMEYKLAKASQKKCIRCPIF